MKFDLDFLYIAATGKDASESRFAPDRWVAATFVTQDLESRDFATLEEVMQAVEDSLQDVVTREDPQDCSQFLVRNGRGTSKMVDCRGVLPRFPHKKVLKRLREILIEQATRQIVDLKRALDGWKTFLQMPNLHTCEVLVGSKRECGVGADYTAEDAIGAGLNVCSAHASILRQFKGPGKVRGRC